MRHRNEKGKYTAEHNQLKDEQWLREQYLNLKKTTTCIAREVGCVSSTVYFSLIRFDIPRRSCKEARMGIKFSESHKKNIIEANRRLGKLHSGSSHWNWQGGKSTSYDRKTAEIKRHPMYRAWRRAVIVIGYCKVCGIKNNLEAHHILPKGEYPQFIHDVANGMCLCYDCHTDLHSLAKGMNSGKLRKNNPEPSRVETRKVQRLLEEGTPSLITSKSVPLVRDEIVQST